MWIGRETEALLKHAVQTRPAVLLTGARQTGKTSLLRHLLPDYHFVSLDFPTEASLADQNPEAFLQLHPAPLIIDEVQYAPSIFRHLKIRIDQDRQRNGQFVITGSQKHALMQYSGESLAGRVDILELETLSRHEIQAATLGLSLTNNILLGGYPELLAAPGQDRMRFYQSYVATYLERDVRSMVNVGSLRDFERFLRACALRTGQLLNKAELARDIGVSPTTANTWLSVLQASGIVVLLEPWFNNRLRSIVKSPKLYLADTGLLTAMLDIRDEGELLRSPSIGAIWETFVFAELRKAQQRTTGNWRCYFTADRAGEVDFLLHHGGLFELYEAKWSEHPQTSEATNITRFSDQLGQKNILRAAVICRATNPYPISSRIDAWPVERLADEMAAHGA